MNDFLNEVTKLRNRIHTYIDEAPLVDSQGVNHERVIFLLNQALTTELLCVRRYKEHFFEAEKLNEHVAAEDFLVRAGEEAEQVDMIAARIQQLGGDPVGKVEISSSDSDTFPSTPRRLETLMREDLIAEWVAVGGYLEIIEALGSDDPITRRLFERIIAREEQLANNMRASLFALAS